MCLRKTVNSVVVPGIAIMGITVTIMLAINGCKTKFGDNTNAMNNKVLIQAESSMGAEEIALAGEQLMAVHSFMLADKVFDMALSKDSENMRAGFYKNLLKPLMVFKGIAVRVKPYVRLNGNIDELEKNIKSFPNSSFKTFVTDGVEDIKDAKTIQDLLVQQRDGFNDFRKFLKAHNGVNLTLNLNPLVYKTAIEEDLKEWCEVSENTDTKFTAECNLVEVAQRKLSSADLILLQQAAAGYVLMYSIYTGYSVENLEELRKMSDGNMSYTEKLELTKKYPELGKLRSDNNLQIVKELGSDYSAAARWVIANQELICPLGKASKKMQRKGFLITNSSSLCVDKSDDSIDKNLGQLDQALSGFFIYTYVSEDSGENKTVKISPFAIFDNPVKDLRQLAPLDENACGNATGYSDPTLGGLFPDGDVNAHLVTKCVR